MVSKEKDDKGGRREKEGKVAGRRGRRERRRRTLPASSTLGASQANWSRVLMRSRGRVAVKRGRGREAGESFLEREASASLRFSLIAKAGIAQRRL
jgi:hypothetical protein